MPAGPSTQSASSSTRSHPWRIVWHSPSSRAQRRMGHSSQGWRLSRRLLATLVSVCGRIARIISWCMTYLFCTSLMFFFIANYSSLAVAMMCAQRGYPCVITMAEPFSVERRKLMRMLGAKVIVTPKAGKGTGMVSPFPPKWFIRLGYNTNCSHVNFFCWSGWKGSGTW